MHSHDYHAERLMLAVADCGRYVYLLRRRGVRDLANQLVDLGVTAMRLAARYRHLSIAVYKRRVDGLLADYAELMDEIVRRYPTLADEVDHLTGRLSPLRKRRLLVTLRADDWLDIDNRIRRKEHRSAGDYLAHLYRLHRR